jgi:hypothetical protein
MDKKVFGLLMDSLHFDFIFVLSVNGMYRLILVVVELRFILQILDNDHRLLFVFEYKQKMIII